jgi:hypothetical protein
LAGAFFGVSEKQPGRKHQLPDPDVGLDQGRDAFVSI